MESMNPPSLLFTIPFDIVKKSLYSACLKNHSEEVECSSCDIYSLIQIQVFNLPIESKPIIPTIFYEKYARFIYGPIPLHAIFEFYVATLNFINIYCCKQELITWHTDEWKDKFEYSLQIVTDKYPEYKDKIHIPSTFSNSLSCIEIIQIFEKAIFWGLAFLEECGKSTQKTLTLNSRMEHNFQNRCTHLLTTNIIYAEYGRAKGDQFERVQQDCQGWNEFKKEQF